MARGLLPLTAEMRFLRPTSVPTARWSSARDEGVGAARGGRREAAPTVRVVGVGVAL